MNQADFQNSTRCDVGRWLLRINVAGDLCLYGFHVSSDGTGLFFDLMSYGQARGRTDTEFLERLFWVRELCDDFLGADADLVCQCSRKVSLDHRLLTWILRANRKGFYSLENAEDPRNLAGRLNARLEEMFWGRIVRYLSYQPARPEAVL